jgi:hypothetical protein
VGAVPSGACSQAEQAGVEREPANWPGQQPVDGGDHMQHELELPLVAAGPGQLCLLAEGRR